MQTMMKTKEVSELLGVNPTTVQRWIKHFNMGTVTNDQGHYVFEERDVQQLKDIQSQLNSGKRMKDIRLEDRVKVAEHKDEKKVPAWQYYEKLDSMMDRIVLLEDKLARKADDVVSYQLLQHRNELNEMSRVLKNIEGRLEAVEEYMKAAQEKRLNHEIEPTKRRRAFAKLFSL